MPFRLPKKCRLFFEPLTGKEKNKLEYLFDGYYLSALVGLAQAKIDSKPDLESSELVDEYPGIYKESGDYIAALLIATEAKRIPVNVTNADELEKLMTSLIDSHSKTRLSLKGENLLNQYASRGINIILDTMMFHTNLEEFYQEYFECFINRKFNN
jgi:hypothetical protein